MRVDVAIVGGGPAGCAAALTLRMKGCSVVVINSPSRRDKLAETASPSLRQLLHSIEADAALSACEPCLGISSNWGYTPPIFLPSMMNPYGHAWFVHRERFDLHLQQAARDSGSMWLETKMRAVEIDQHDVAITTARNICVYSKWVVFAAGSPSGPARFTHEAPLVVDSLVAFWSYLPLYSADCSLSIEAAENGWWYLCPGENGRSLACYITDAAALRAHQLPYVGMWNDLFCSTRLSRRFERKVPAISLNAAPVGIMALRQTHGLRWIAVGDAAVKLDPISSSGVSTALASGQRAAQAVADTRPLRSLGQQPFPRAYTPARAALCHRGITESGRVLGGHARTIWRIGPFRPDCFRLSRSIRNFWVGGS
jgi:flavin-dependent dehydrogenase